MITDQPEKFGVSASLTRIFLVISFLVVCTLPTNVFAKDNPKSSSPSTIDDASKHETDKTEAPEDEVEESQSLDDSENKTAKAANYKQVWDDAMVAAPAFDD